MATTKSKPTPRVRIARPAGRPYQLRYICPSSGRQVRMSTGSRNIAEARTQQRELEAKLLLGLPDRRPVKQTGPHMPWEEFREEYRTLHLVTLRPKSTIDTESRLDIVERIVKPHTLGDMADRETLHRLQARLLAGAEGRRPAPRSPHTVKGYMAVLVAALNWARLQGWLDKVPPIKRIKTSRLRGMKGRPITEAEFQRMLDATEGVVGADAAPSWRYLLRGAWASALRLDELLHVSWDIDGTIRPMRRGAQLSVLLIPAAMQKNATEEAIPLLPWFEAVLMETPTDDRTGWAFTPKTLQTKFGYSTQTVRLGTPRVGRVLSKIGEVADVTVDPGDHRTGRPTKYASAHDLRRSCTERLLGAGVPPLVIARVMRHASWQTTQRYYAPGNVQADAAVLQDRLGKSVPKKTGYTLEGQST